VGGKVWCVVSLAIRESLDGLFRYRLNGLLSVQLNVKQRLSELLFDDFLFD